MNKNNIKQHGLGTMDAVVTNTEKAQEKRRIRVAYAHISAWLFFDLFIWDKLFRFFMLECICFRN